MPNTQLQNGSFSSSNNHFKLYILIWKSHVSSEYCLHSGPVLLLLSLKRWSLTRSDRFLPWIFLPGTQWSLPVVMVVFHFKFKNKQNMLLSLILSYEFDITTVITWLVCILPSTSQGQTIFVRVHMALHDLPPSSVNLSSSPVLGIYTLLNSFFPRCCNDYEYSMWALLIWDC